jgi:hypothetical protein
LHAELGRIEGYNTTSCRNLDGDVEITMSKDIVSYYARIRSSANVCLLPNVPFNFNPSVARF